MYKYMYKKKWWNTTLDKKQKTQHRKHLKNIVDTHVIDMKAWPAYLPIYSIYGRDFKS